MAEPGADTGRDAPPVGPTNGPPVSQAEFDLLFDRLRRWTPGEPTDERGAVTGVTPEVVLDALATPRSGRTVSLALPINRTSGPDNAKPALHHMVDLGDVEPPEPSAHKDFLGFDYHGKAVSHLDALCHIGYRGELFGGVASAAAFSSLGSQWAAVTNVADGLVVRGVLIDVPRVRGVEWLEPGDGVRAADLEQAEEALSVRIGPGDAVLLRSGHGARRAALGAWDSDAASAGLHVDAMPLLADRGIVLLG